MAKGRRKRKATLVDLGMLLFIILLYYRSNQIIEELVQQIRIIFRSRILLTPKGKASLGSSNYYITII